MMRRDYEKRERKRDFLLQYIARLGHIERRMFMRRLLEEEEEEQNTLYIYVCISI